uniref:Uncharacterized protein n=1 Tax=Arundo donax TaxID=35708 RepID=A0A0A9BC64_ARUDO
MEYWNIWFEVQGCECTIHSPKRPKLTYLFVRWDGLENLYLVSLICKAW